MRDGNTMSKPGYIFEHVFWGALMIILYKILCFRCVPDLTYRTSKLLLWGLVLVFSAVGIALTWGRRRNNLSLYANIALPFETYTVISYWPNMKRAIAAAVAVAGTVILVYCLMVMCRKIENGEGRRAVFARRIRNSLLGGRAIAAVCLSLLIIPLGVKAAFGYSLFQPSVSPVASANAEKYTIAQNLDELCKLEEGTWETLDTGARLDLLQTVANIEDAYLGLPHELNVVAANLGDSIVGQYDDSTHTIAVSTDYLETHTAHEMLDTICHEAYHAYQHRVCDAHDALNDSYKDLLLFYRAGIYEDEFANYDGGDNFDVYYSQQVEVDSRNYAADAVEDYYMKIAAN